MTDFEPIKTNNPYYNSEEVSTLFEHQPEEITELLMGQKVTKVATDHVILSNGTTLKFEGNDGGCSCSAGCYDLTELNGVDNIITKVEFLNEPDDDYNDGRPYPGKYAIFVYADNSKINLATFEGTDGNGYYGTGYHIFVRPPSKG